MTTDLVRSLNDFARNKHPVIWGMILIPAQTNGIGYPVAELKN